MQESILNSGFEKLAYTPEMMSPGQVMPTTPHRPVQKSYAQQQQRVTNPYRGRGVNLRKMRQNPQAFYRRYGQSEGEYGGFNPISAMGYAGVGFGAGGLAAAGMARGGKHLQTGAQTAGRAAFKGQRGLLRGGVGGALLGLGLYAGTNWLKNQKRVAGKSGMYSFGGSREYANDDPRMFASNRAKFHFSGGKQVAGDPNAGFRSLPENLAIATAGAGLGGYGGMMLGSHLAQSLYQGKSFDKIKNQWRPKHFLKGSRMGSLIGAGLGLAGAYAATKGIQNRKARRYGLK
jgi:hypothetical protein